MSVMRVDLRRIFWKWELSFISHFSLLGVPFLALKCQVLRVSHFPFLTSHFPFLIPYFLFPHFRREVVSTVSASNQKWDMRSWNSEVRNGNSEARNGNSEVRNGNQENSFPISQKASEKWEVGLKWEFPFLKYPPQDYGCNNSFSKKA